ncbi:unnamed protein product [Arabidopsis lyrata]|nr:unnamed protein product [Arabidopsis lyrata]
MADLELFSRLFANREEPAGDRVNMCFKLNTIKVVLKALTPEEIETIRPCFGKLLDVYSKHVFSGKLAHFLLKRRSRGENRETRADFGKLQSETSETPVMFMTRGVHGEEEKL